MTKSSIASVTNERANVGWRDVWGVVKVSAEKRLGRPLLRMYLVLGLVGIVVVALSVLVNHSCAPTRAKVGTTRPGKGGSFAQAPERSHLGFQRRGVFRPSATAI